VIKTLNDINEFKKQKNNHWSKNAAYWLKGPLRHVVDIGEYIVDQILIKCSTISNKCPVIVDMGFGDAWLLKALIEKKCHCQYIGIDSNKVFFDNAQKLFKEYTWCGFKLMDLELPLDVDIKADVVVNSFTFFELADLKQGMENAFHLLKKEGSLFIATIDKTYLILAYSRNFEEFKTHLKEYEHLPGVKYFFQPIDLGDKASEILKYPSILYSLDDYFYYANKFGFRITNYKEHVFTAKPIPKIYIHFELVLD